MSVRVSLCLSQTVCVCHRQSVSVTHSLCLSQTIFVCHRQSVSDTDTFLDHSWPGFPLFIRDFHQDLSVRFELVPCLTTNTNFVDPCPYPSMTAVKDSMFFSSSIDCFTKLLLKLIITYCLYIIKQPIKDISHSEHLLTTQFRQRYTHVADRK